MLNSLVNDSFIKGLRDKSLLTEKFSVNKILLLLFSSNNYCIINEPLNSLINNYKEIEYILKLKIPKIMNFFYNNKDIIHEILYNEDSYINIEYDEEKKNLSENFYLNLLILDNPDILNYSYNLNYIKELNKIQKDTNQNYKSIILARFIIDLINNYKQLDNYDEVEEKKELEKIENQNLEIIKNNIMIFKDIDINLNEYNIKEMPIDEIYAKIINSLIIKGKFEDFEYSYKIINQLDLENIYITKTMFKTLSELLETNNIVKKYMITKKEDLNDEKKINFYYILFKYILKNSFYIYQMNFLNKTKKFIIKLIKNNEISNNYINEKKQETIKYILEILEDTKYYSTKNQLKELEQLEQLKEILNYYKEFLFESKKEDIIYIQDIIQNKKSNINYQKYLEEYEIAKKMNSRLFIIKFLLIKNDENKSENKIKEIVKNWEKLEEMINDNKCKKMRNDSKKILLSLFNDEKNKENLLKIFTQEKIENFIKENNHLTKPHKKEAKKDKKTEVKVKENNINNKNNETPIDDNILSTNKKDDGTTTNASTNYTSKKNYLIGDDLPPVAIHNNDIENDIPLTLLTKSQIMFHTNERKKEPYIIYDVIYLGENKMNFDVEKFKRYKLDYLNIKIIEENHFHENYKKFFEFLDEMENRLKKEFQNNYNLLISLNFNKEDIKNSIPDIFNITCIYKFYDSIDNQTYSYKDDNILYNGTNSKSQGLTFLIEDINKEKYKGLQYKNDKSNNKQEIQMNDIKKLKNKNNKKVDDLLRIIPKVNFVDDSTRSQTFIFEKKADYYKILEPIRIIGKHNNSADLIIELKNGYYISGGCENRLIVYDTNFTEKVIINDLNERIYKFGEKMSLENIEQIITLVCITNKEFNIVNLDKKTFNPNIKSSQIPKKKPINFIEMKENNFIINGREGVSYYIDLFNVGKQLIEYEITNKTYRGGLRINNKNAILTSNSILFKEEGEDSLILYNTKKKSSIQIKGYSFTLSVNNCALMPREEVKSNNKIILCACKKYNNKQKNGILLVNPQLGDNKNVKDPFYEIDYFEVYCFCPILLIENKNSDYYNINENYRKNIIIKDTDYFLVGGFEEGKGKIKLFKIIYGNKAYETKIEFLQDIEIDDENFEEFDGPITCMIQSRITGNILITCYNGNVYLFTQPNIQYYLNNNYN